MNKVVLACPGFPVFYLHKLYFNPHIVHSSCLFLPGPGRPPSSWMLSPFFSPFRLFRLFLPGPGRPPSSL